MDDTLARLTRASAALDDLALASSLESALLRAGRLEEAFLLRWRRGEPSPVAGALVERQRPVLAALAAAPALQPVACPTCGPLGCGGGSGLEVALGIATGGDRDSLRWTWLRADGALPEAPVVGARTVRRPSDLEALVSTRTLVHLELRSAALHGDAPLPPALETLEVRIDLRADTLPGRLAPLALLRDLSLRGRVTDEALDDALVACDGRLERLELEAELLTDVGLEALRRAPRLRALRLDHAAWTDGSCLGALVDVGAPLERFTLRRAPRSTWRTFDALGDLATLRSLDLYDLDLRDGAGDLAALPDLRELELTYGQLDPDTSADLFAEAPLERVALDGVRGVDDRTLEALAASSTLRALELCAAGELTPRGWSALSHAPALRSLSITRCALDARGLVELSRSRSIETLELAGIDGLYADLAFAALGTLPLERLVLTGDVASPAALEALADRTCEVKELDLQPCAAEAVGATLAAVARLPALERLTLRWPAPTGAVTALAGAPALRTLSLPHRRELDDAELAALRACFWLERLELACDAFTRADLQERLPSVEVRSRFEAW